MFNRVQKVDKCRSKLLSFEGKNELRAPWGIFLLLTSHLVLRFQMFSQRSFTSVDPSRGWVGEWGALCGRQRGRLCTKTVAGAAVTVAVLLLAPRCSQDEVHRCSHSLQQYIGCLEQCISVKNNPSWGHFSRRSSPHETRRRKSSSWHARSAALHDDTTLTDGRRLIGRSEIFAAKLRREYRRKATKWRFSRIKDVQHFV